MAISWPNGHSPESTMRKIIFEKYKKYEYQGIDGMHTFYDKREGSKVSTLVSILDS